MNWEESLHRSREKALAVLEVCARPGPVLVVMQDNPDPDALASALALREMVRERLEKRVRIGYGGTIGRAENRAMMNVLRIDAHRLEPARVARCKTVILVDAQPLAGNSSLTDMRVPDVVIDHHLLPGKRSWKAQVEDLRPEYGATSTILYEYLRSLDIRISGNLCTALFYGIQSDTQDLGREATPSGVRAYQELFLEADKRKLSRIRRAPVPQAYFQMLSDSLADCVVAGATVISRIRNCRNADMLAEVAELLMRLEGMRSAVCYGLFGDRVLLSARSADARSNTAARMKHVVARLGTGGGHHTMAGGQVPVEGDPEMCLALVYDRILAAFAPGGTPVPLTRPPGAPAAGMAAEGVDGGGTAPSR